MRYYNICFPIYYYFSRLPATLVRPDEITGMDLGRYTIKLSWFQDLAAIRSTSITNKEIGFEVR